MSANELYRSQLARRTVYASAMGVDSWVARRPLPGTALVLPVTSKPVSSPVSGAASKSVDTASTPVSAPTQRRGSSQRDELVSSLASIEGRKDSRKKTAQSSGETAASVTPVTAIAVAELPQNFELYYAALGDLVLVDDISQRNCAMSVYQNWLAALAQALDRSLQTAANGEASSLRWPDALGSMATTAGRAGGGKLEAAREVVSAWLSRRLAGSERHLLLMGDVPGLLFSDELLAELNAGGSKPAVLRSPSSAELWQSPHSKRQLWRQMAAVRASQ